MKDSPLKLVRWEVKRLNLYFRKVTLEAVYLVKETEECDDVDEQRVGQTQWGGRRWVELRENWR